MYSYQLQLNLQSNYTKAQKEIHSGAINFLARNSEKELSVSKLCKATNISRSTFYLYYSSIYELLTEIEDEWLRQLLNLDHELTNSHRKSSTDFS